MGMQVFQNFDWEAVAVIVAAVIGLGGGALGAYRFKENWSPASRYRELRLLRSRESKAKEMNSASCDRIKEAFASSINYDDCKLEQYRFAGELKNPRTNLKQGEESASLLDAVMLKFAGALLLIVLFLDGLLKLRDLSRQWHINRFVLLVLMLYLLLAAWAVVTHFIKYYTWNGVIKKSFDDFLKPVFLRPTVFYDTQVEFQKAIQSFHKVYDNSTILSLGRACRRMLGIGSFLLFLAVVFDAAMIYLFHSNSFSWFHLISLLILTLIGIAVQCCLLTYYAKIEELVQEEKEKYLWYNPLIDIDHTRHYEKLNKIFEFGYWLGKTFGKSKKR